MTPIRNKRYHCKECEDYDICADCYHNRKDDHVHQDYEEVDGRLILKEREERITKVIIDEASRHSIGRYRKEAPAHLF